MYFNILAKIELAEFFEVHLHACYDFARGIYCRNPSLPCMDGIPPRDHHVYQLNDDPTGAFLEGKVVMVLLPHSLMTRILRLISPTCSWAADKLHVTVLGIMSSTCSNSISSRITFTL